MPDTIIKQQARDTTLEPLKVCLFKHMNKYKVYVRILWYEVIALLQIDGAEQLSITFAQGVIDKLLNNKNVVMFKAERVRMLPDWSGNNRDLVQFLISVLLNQCNSKQIIGFDAAVLESVLHRILGKSHDCLDRMRVSKANYFRIKGTKHRQGSFNCMIRQRINLVCQKRITYRAYKSVSGLF